jgi:CO/xanthine dehydrogenase FAD-binding subunit
MLWCTLPAAKKSVKKRHTMNNKPKTVFFARNMSDVLSWLSSVNELRIMAGCTQNPVMPNTALVVRSVEDLHIIDRRERFIDIGSAVPLSIILERGQKRIPQTLDDAIKSTANTFVRNIGTLGGNICAEGRKRSLFAPLYALDAMLEFKSEKQTMIMPISRFSKVPPKSLLTKIRVPINEWDIAIYKRLGPSGLHSENSAFFVFLAMAQKGFLSDVRIVFSAETLFRNRNLENNMIGTRLPLTRKNIQSFIEQTIRSFAPDHELQEQDQEQNIITEESTVFNSKLAERQFLNMLSCSLEQLS